MTFSKEIERLGYVTLKHDRDNKNLIQSYLSLGIKRSGRNQELEKKMIEEYKLAFCNHAAETSFFVNFITNNRLAKKDREDFYKYLLLYTKQFYPDHELLRNIDNTEDLMMLFNICYKKLLEIQVDFLDTEDIKTFQKKEREIKTIHDIYGIIEDFMIRFYGYSVIGVSNQKHIITAKNNCDKVFFEELVKGYDLFREQQLALRGTTDPYYEFLPVLPTKDVGFPIEEYIEVSGSDEKIENKQFITVM